MTASPAAAAGDWRARLAELVAGDPDQGAGAELEVFDPDDGTSVFREALARSVRFDDDDDMVVWIRPVWSYRSLAPERGDPEWLFSLNRCRTRGLGYTTVAVNDAGEVEGDLVNHQRAVVRSAQGDMRVELDRWDYFLLYVTAQTEIDLAKLSDDSWWGEYA